MRVCCCILVLVAGLAAPLDVVLPLTSDLHSCVQSALAQERREAEPRLDARDHILDEGDYLLIKFYDGERLNSFAVQVDSAGDVMLPYLGTVLLGGLKAREAADKLTEGYRYYYHNPTVAVEIISYGEIEIFLFGTDFSGRIVKINNGSRLLDFMKSYSDEIGIGQYRQVHIIRGTEPGKFAPDEDTLPAQTMAVPAMAIKGNAPRDNLPSYTNWRPWLEQCKQDPSVEIYIIDPLSILIEGELSKYNMTLKDKDVVFVPAPEHFVAVEGVAKPGLYELLGEESLGDVLRLAGSINYNSDLMNTVVERRDDSGRLEHIFLNLYPAIDDLPKIESFKLRNRDKIRIVPREERVFVLGEVKMANAFSFNYDSTVLDYIALAGGETPSANMTWIAVIRQGRDAMHPFLEPEVIQINFKELHKGLPSAADYTLFPGDVIYVPPKGFEFKFTEVVSAASAVISGFTLIDRINNAKE